MQYRKREVVILNEDGFFTILHYADEPSHKFFTVLTKELKEPKRKKVR